MGRSTSQRCASFFSGTDRASGEFCQQTRKVKLVDANSQLVLAQIEESGTTPYRVVVQVDAKDLSLLHVACDCPLFRVTRRCKHVWATLLEIDDAVAMDVSPGGEPLVIVANQIDLEATFKVHGEGVVASQVARGPAMLPTLRSWRKSLDSLDEHLSRYTGGEFAWDDEKPTVESRAWYVIDLENLRRREQLRLRIFVSRRLPSGQWSKPHLKAVNLNAPFQITDLQEQSIVRILFAATHAASDLAYGLPDSLIVQPDLSEAVLPTLAETGRLVWTESSDNYLEIETTKTLRWDAGAHWRLQLNVEPNEEFDDTVSVKPTLIRQDAEKEDVTDWERVVAAFEDGWLLFADRLAKTDPRSAAWVNALHHNEGLSDIPIDQLDAFLEAFAGLSHLPPTEFAEQLDVKTEIQRPRGSLTVKPVGEDSPHLGGNVTFLYGERRVEPDKETEAVWNPDTRSLVQRDVDTEQRMCNQLLRVGFEPNQLYRNVDVLIRRDRFVSAVTTLSDDGWEIISTGKPLRANATPNVTVQSGTDWFDLTVAFDYGVGGTTSLPTLLKAIREKQDFIVLDDGSLGILPAEWLRKNAPLVETGEQLEDGNFRFFKSQALMIDSLLAEQDAEYDVSFAELCRKLENFDGIKPSDEPDFFQGELRTYQREGLGWFQFLRDLGFGGCLADDMGLGKTVQILSLLQDRQNRTLEPDEALHPSIVVVPKSLVFNWIDESSRFTPKLRVVNYTGPDRKELLEQIPQSDVVVTTYGILRRDILELREQPFDYAILDEATAIKNSNSQASKAARLIRARYRMALTGTPIENHLGELWSLFEFLNPGMLGRSERFKKMVQRADDDEGLEWLRRAIHPYVLRRTKDEVLTELPEKSEQSLYCSMTSKQSQLYDELREHYRDLIGKQVKEFGIARSKIHVLEALLRLRQAACDPRLLDDKQEAGAKVEMLFEHLEELLDSGHKALVFSQFTSMLALVRNEMEQREWTYEYLDGQTRNREERVKRFQNDDDCRLFLISLKAGGHGLNLTAADYVFILDPWWNPAVEAQAIDRAHRIGQTKPVMAYRLICTDTVEDKIIHLQESKRELADAIISANESLIRRLTAEDLQLLL